MRATAAVLPELHADFVVEEVELEEPRAGEALVRIVACGVCHTDDITRHGDLPFPLPGVLGHEGAGVVEAVGAGVSDVAPGDRVVIGWPFCGECRNCLDGQPRYCLQLGPPSPAAAARTARPRSAAGDGSVAQPLLRPVVVRHPRARARERARAGRRTTCRSSAGPLACGIATGAGAILNVLRPGLGASIVVYGVGSVGLAAIMAARLTGATTIVAVDVQPACSTSRASSAPRTRSTADDDPVAARARDLRRAGRLSLECTGWSRSSAAPPTRSACSARAC